MDARNKPHSNPPRPTPPDSRPDCRIDIQIDSRVDDPLAIAVFRATAHRAPAVAVVFAGMIGGSGRDHNDRAIGLMDQRVRNAA